LIAQICPLLWPHYRRQTNQKVSIKRNCCPITTNGISCSTCYSEKSAEVKRYLTYIIQINDRVYTGFGVIKYFWIKIYPLSFAKPALTQTKIYLFLFEFDVNRNIIVVVF
jgi:hypothetical protein